MTPRTRQARADALSLIEQAQTLLYRAAQAACPLQGWAEQWRLIGDHADATKALWHLCNDAPLPVGHDEENTEPELQAPPPPVSRCRHRLEDNPHLTDK